MLLSDSKKSLFAVLILLLFMTTACRYFQTSDTNTAKPFTPEEIKSDIPFLTKEPETFQTEIVTTIDNLSTKKFIARSGKNYRLDYDFGTKKQVSIIQAEKIFKIFSEKKIYTETSLSEGFSIEESPMSFLTNELVNTQFNAEYTKIGTENNRTQYRVKFGETEKAETIIFVEETLKLPIRQEFYSLENGQKNLTMVIELKNFKSEANDDLFILPKDFKKVSAEEFKKILQSEESK